MDKKQVAEFLGVTIRAVERYQQQGKLNPQYVKGKTSMKAVYIDEEVTRLKEELEAPPAIEMTSQTPTTTTALAKRGDVAPMIAALAQLLEERQEGKGSRAQVPVESKPLLKISEAQALTGLSRDTLKEAIEKKKLKARKEGKAYRITRKSLDEYITKNF